MPEPIPEFAQAAMSTIPTIFKDSQLSYTVVGGDRKAASTGMSAVLLNRGGRYLRRSVFHDFEKSGFDYVVSVEGPSESYDVEELSLRYPFVKFILLKNHASPGEQINIAASEIKTPLFFVLRNDVRLMKSGGAARIAERLFSTAQTPRLCTVPVVQNARFETLPTLIAPAFYKGSVKTIPFVPAHEGLPSLYPFDGVGIYEKNRFIQLGGFDATLTVPYWQYMDFGFRSHLWGEQITSTQLVKVMYEGELPAEDISIDENYIRFFLKNLAPVFRGDSAHIPLRRFPSYLFKSGQGFLKAWDSFREGRRWVYTNRYRFNSDARSLTELWETGES